MKKYLLTLILYGAATGILFSFIEVGIVQGFYMRTGSSLNYIMAILLAGIIYSLIIVVIGGLILVIADAKSGRPEKTKIMAAVLTSTMFFFVFASLHINWFLAGRPFHDPAGIAVTAALVVCMIPVYFLMLSVSALLRQARPVFRIIAVLAVLVFLYRAVLFSGLGGTSPEKEVPNFLIVSIDTLRADHIGCYGYDKARTGAIDSLAAEGMLFERAYTTMPATGPAHNSLMTGMHPRSMGVVANGLYPSRKGAFRIAEYLKQKGYRTAAFVSGATLDEPMCGLKNGFDIYSDAFSFLDILDRTFMIRILHHAVGYDMPGERLAGPVTDESLRWLEKNGEKPFFLFVHYFDPHFPYAPPVQYIENGGFAGGAAELRKHKSLWENQCSRRTEDPELVEKTVALYDAEIAYVNDQLSRLFSFIGGGRIAGKTYIILVSDHGEGLWNHDDCFHGTRLYEEQVHVPMIIKGPGVAAGVRIDQPVQLVDVPPTLVSILEEDVPGGIHGFSLKDILFQRGEMKRDVVFFEAIYANQARDGGSSLMSRSETVGMAAREYKFISHRDGRKELFDLGGDPGEILNIYHERESLAAEFDSMVKFWDTRTEKMDFVSDLSQRQLKTLFNLGYLK